MRTFGLLFALLASLHPTASAQEIDAPEGTIIRSADVSGPASDRLSSELRQAINALAGDPLNRDHLRQLADRIEREQPDMVVAIRGIPAPENGVRIIFLAARISDDRKLETNINSRYIVESVDVEGIPEDDVSRALRDDLQSLVGGRLDHDEAQRLEKRLISELPGHDIRRKISRGSERGRIRLVFEVSRAEALRWIHFVPSNSKLLYHSKQGWSGYLDLPIGNRDHRVSLLFPLDNADDLLEEYTGYGVRVESRRVGTERLGISLELSNFNQEWEGATLAALAADPRIPEAYRQRTTVAPAVTFAIGPRLRVSGGVSISELESLSRSPASQMASAVTGAVGYDQRWEAPAATHLVEAGFSWRSAETALESDLVYTRYFVHGNYQYQRGKSEVLAGGSLGRINGQAPLFERFSLGDSSTLRGWNKYDVAPAGGDRMFHTSVEYRHRGFAFFIDAGSVWELETDARVRFASGFGYHRGQLFITLGFPLNTDDLDAMFTAGVRF
jgi:hypothetical protein